MGLIIGIVIVVAIVVLLITGKITRNSIKVSASKCGTEVYTKVEVDQKFNNLRSNSCDADDFCEVNFIATTLNKDLNKEQIKILEMTREDE